MLPDSEIRKLFKEKPEIFDFYNLPPNIMRGVIADHFDEINELFDLNKISIDMKFFMLSSRHGDKAESFVDFKSMSPEECGRLATIRPDLFFKYNLPSDGLSSSQVIRLIKYSPDQGMDILFDSFDRIVSTAKIEYRGVIIVECDLSRITVEHIELFPARLFIKAVGRNETGTKLCDEVKECIKEKLMAEILAGLAVSSKRLNKIMEKW